MLTAQSKDDNRKQKHNEYKTNASSNNFPRNVCLSILIQIQSPLLLILKASDIIKMKFWNILQPIIEKKQSVYEKLFFIGYILAYLSTLHLRRFRYQISNCLLMINVSH